MIYNVNCKELAYQMLPSFLRDYDIEMRSGDFRYGDTSQQDAFILIQAHKGQFYQYPTIGVGIASKISATVDIVETKRAIREQLEDDGLKVNEIYLLSSKEVEDLGITDADLINAVTYFRYIIYVDAVRQWEYLLQN